MLENRFTPRKSQVSFHLHLLVNRQELRLHILILSRLKKQKAARNVCKAMNTGFYTEMNDNNLQMFACSFTVQEP